MTIVKHLSEGTEDHLKKMEEMGRMLECLEGRLDRIAMVSWGATAEEQAMASGLAIEEDWDGSEEESLDEPPLPELQSNTEAHRIVDIELGAAGTTPNSADFPGKSQKERIL